MQGERASMRYADPQHKIVLKKEDSEGWRCRKLGGLAGKKKLEEAISGRVANDGRLIIMSE